MIWVGLTNLDDPDENVPELEDDAIVALMWVQWAGRVVELERLRLAGGRLRTV